ncbi:CLIP domain-containing serine protease B15-like [Drosophila teissieri]|uniref:CLIP domain-containing serine protease B15-like n=1 Tax=Drosophila teissieri TaxID=7243 RepID=UPI001CBA5D81|nr:CLIP domain-containing serine protease B15-like [Drosophila teissieri]
MKIFTAEIALLACLVLGARKGSSSLLTEDCGTTKHPSRVRRVVGGEDADRFANPWMVLVLGQENKICGGSLITRLFVLTSATCVTSSPKQVVLGEYDRNCTTADCMSSRQVIDISQRFSHDEFDMQSVGKYDIGLIRLARKVLISDYIRPICLSVDLRVGRGARSFTATGWGRTHSSDTSNILQKVTLRKLNRRSCTGMFWMKLDASQLCVGGLNKDTCFGDSGGPLTVKSRTDGSGHGKRKSRTFLVGMASFGSHSCSGVGVYTNVEHYMDWIVNTIHESNMNSSQASHVRKSTAVDFDFTTN